MMATVLGAAEWLRLRRVLEVSSAMESAGVFVDRPRAWRWTFVWAEVRHRVTDVTTRLGTRTKYETDIVAIIENKRTGKATCKVLFTGSAFTFDESLLRVLVRAERVIAENVPPEGTLVRVPLGVFPGTGLFGPDVRRREVN